MEAMAVLVQAGVVPDNGARIVFEDRVEVALDCAHCGRTHRTVIFGTLGRPGRCTPTGHAFPGTVEAAEPRGPAQEGEVRRAFLLRYDYTPMVDAKYPGRVSAPMPTWGRLRFTVTCPACGAVSSQSVQNNTVLPWTCRCPCGLRLYTELLVFPTFS